MIISFPICEQASPLVSYQAGNNLRSSLKFSNHRKDKIVIVMGATGTGKSRLAIDLATQFPAEIINCDKIQVYKGLDIVANKVSAEECRGIPHHLLGLVDPDDDFTAADFCHHAKIAIESISQQDKIPIIAGGSNSFIQSLVHGDAYFRSRFECCFLWIDVYLPTLKSFVSRRVDKMIEAGLVDEVRGIYDPEADYTRGIRRAIGVPEMDKFLRSEGDASVETQVQLLEEAIKQIKENAYKLACRQVQKINRLRDFQNLHHLDATQVFDRHGEKAEKAWEKLVLGPSAVVVDQFLYEGSRMATLSQASRQCPLVSRYLPSAAVTAAGNR